ncbi:glycoside hydrolase family 4 [Halarchaeum sp. P4]|uniref:family 4 glycosyl hydrolase n=1 Tax=Halarchaeum sp. P4 TaxID=3421639 RepID=UPI003EBF6863
MHQLSTSATESGTERADDLRIGYVGGGSRGWARTLINDLAQCPDLGGTVALYDVRPEAARLNADLGNHVMARGDVVGDWTFEVHEAMADALAGADVVVCSTQDPPEETFVHDLDVPKEYDIHQTVGDTVGPGGVMRSLRSIPQYREIAATVREHCPDAWVLNYTNPMTVCTRTLYAEYPDVNAIGLCHEVFKTQELFADIAERYVDAAEDVSREAVDVNVKGINHFTWVDEARWRGHDLYQYLDAELESRKPLPGFERGALEGESYWTNNYQVAFDLYRTFGLLGAAGDRHLAEFVPWYLADVEDAADIERWGIRLTPSSARVPDGEADAAAEVERVLDGEETFELYESGEEFVDIVRALVGIEPLKTHLNYLNEGQIPDLERGAVVETNALVTGDDVSPVTAGPFPDPVREHVSRAVSNQETLIEAGMTGDLGLAFRAFRNDPLVTLDPADARALFADLVERERDYLDAYDVNDAAVLAE